MPTDVKAVYDQWLIDNPAKSNRLEEITANTIREFRDAIESHPENTYPEDETYLPQSAIRHCENIIIFSLAMEMGIDLDSAGKTAYTRADIFLRQIPYGRWNTIDEEETRGARSPSYTVPERSTGRALPVILAFILSASTAFAGWIEGSSTITDPFVQITYIPTNYAPLSATLFGHLYGIDAKIGTLQATASGISTNGYIRFGQQYTNALAFSATTKITFYDGLNAFTWWGSTTNTIADFPDPQNFPDSTIIYVYTNENEFFYFEAYPAQPTEWGSFTRDELTSPLSSEYVTYISIPSGQGPVTIDIPITDYPIPLSAVTFHLDAPALNWLNTLKYRVNTGGLNAGTLDDLDSSYFLDLRNMTNLAAHPAIAFTNGASGIKQPLTPALTIGVEGPGNDFMSQHIAFTYVDSSGVTNKLLLYADEDGLHIKDGLQETIASTTWVDQNYMSILDFQTAATNYLKWVEAPNAYDDPGEHNEVAKSWYNGTNYIYYYTEDARWIRTAGETNWVQP